MTQQFGTPQFGPPQFGPQPTGPAMRVAASYGQLPMAPAGRPSVGYQWAPPGYQAPAGFDAAAGYYETPSGWFYWTPPDGPQPIAIAGGSAADVNGAAGMNDADAWIAPMDPPRSARPPHRWIWVITLQVVFGAWFIFSVYLSFKSLGDPDKPMTLGDSAGAMIFNALFNLVVTGGFAALAVLVVIKSRRLDAATLGIRRPRGRQARDVALATPTYVLLLLGSAFGVTLLLHALGITGREGYSGGDGGWAVFVSGLLVSITAGFTEELQLFAIPLTLLYWGRHRLGRGFVPVTIVLLELLRLSIHVYYGWGMLFVVPWIFGAYFLWRRVRSVWPFVLGHALYDALLFGLQSKGVYSAVSVVLLILILIAGIVGVVLLACSWPKFPAERVDSPARTAGDN